MVLGARSVGMRNGTIVDVVGKLTGRLIAEPITPTDRPAAHDLNLPIPAEFFAIQSVEIEVRGSLVSLIVATRGCDTN